MIPPLANGRWRLHRQCQINGKSRGLCRKCLRGSLLHVHHQHNLVYW